MKTRRPRAIKWIRRGSVTSLFGAYIPESQFEWLRAKTPVAKIAYSIYVYDLTKPLPLR